MDIIITALGEFVWTASCAVVNFCVSSGLSVIAVFVSFLCALLASAFYKYTISREQMSDDDAARSLIDQNNDDLDKPLTSTSMTECPITSTAQCPITSMGQCPMTSMAQFSMTSMGQCPMTSMGQFPITSMADCPMKSLFGATMTDEPNNNTNTIDSLSEIEICMEENTNGNGNESKNETNGEQTSNDILVDTIEGSEDEIQKQQIANIYRLLNDQHLINNWTTTDFLDQLKMYGLHAFDDDELESS